MLGRWGLRKRFILSQLPLCSAHSQCKIHYSGTYKTSNILVVFFSYSYNTWGVTNIFWGNISWPREDELSVTNAWSTLSSAPEIETADYPLHYCVASILRHNACTINTTKITYMWMATCYKRPKVKIWNSWRDIRDLAQILHIYGIHSKPRKNFEISGNVVSITTLDHWSCDDSEVSTLRISGAIGSVWIAVMSPCQWGFETRSWIPSTSTFDSRSSLEGDNLRNQVLYLIWWQSLGLGLPKWARRDII